MPRSPSSDLASPGTSEPGESGCSRACLSRLPAGMGHKVQSMPALSWGQRGAALRVLELGSLCSPHNPKGLLKPGPRSREPVAQWLPASRAEFAAATRRFFLLRLKFWATSWALLTSQVIQRMK